MTQHPDNVKRGERAKLALMTYFEEMELRDLLTDLRHYCDTHGIDFSKEDRIAHDNYLSEIEDPTL